MSAPAAATPSIRSDATDGELILCLDKMSHGASHPSNVLDTNPCMYKPSNLPDDIWYLVPSMVNKDNKDGLWKTEGEPCKIFSTSGIIGWRSTSEFYEGQAPYWRKTDWVLQEYWVTQRGLSEGSDTAVFYGICCHNDEARSLCRVFRDSKQNKNHEMLQELASTETVGENKIHPFQSNVPDSDIGQSSTSRPQVSEDVGTGVLALTVRVPVHWEENYFSRDECIELLDLANPLSPNLDNPASRSSSSENSSCLSMSSGECFDALALLQDLEPENSPKDAGCKFSVSASTRPNEVVMLPASSAPISGRTDALPPEENLKTMSSKDALKLTSRNQNPNLRIEGPSSNNHNVTPSFDTSTAAPDGKNVAVVRRIKKLKNYLCFLAF